MGCQLSRRITSTPESTEKEQDGSGMQSPGRRGGRRKTESVRTSQTRITATGSRRQTGPLSGINVDNTAQFVLMPRLMECALPMLPPKLKNWWVECAGNVESVEAWRFAEMFLLADPEVRELVGGIDERLKADSETASQKSEMIYNSMTSQRGGSTTRRPLNSPFLACYLLPHVVDWDGPGSVSAQALLALHAACCQVYASHGLLPPDTLRDLLLCVAREAGLALRGEPAGESLKERHEWRIRHLTQLRKLHGMLEGGGRAEWLQQGHLRLEGTQGHIEERVVRALSDQASPRVVAYLSPAGTGKTVLASSMVLRGLSDKPMCVAAYASASSALGGRPLVEALALQLAKRDASMCEAVIAGARELNYTEPSASRKSSLFRGVLHRLTSYGKNVSKKWGASKRSRLHSAANATGRASHSWNEPRQRAHMIPEEESSKEPAEKSGAQEEEDHDAPLNARASMDMKWSVPGSAMSRAGHGRQRRLSAGVLPRKYMDPTQLGPLVQRLLVGPLSSAAGSALAMRESMEGGADMPANGVPLRQKASLRRKNSGLTGQVVPWETPLVLVLDNMDVLDPAVTCEILNCLSKAPSWVRVLVFGRPTSELQEALNGADARLVEWDAEADAADVANACRQLVASSAPRAWLEDSGVSGLNKEASKILIERVSGSYAYLGGIMRCGWVGNLALLPEGTDELLNLAYREAQRSVDESVWRAWETQVLPRLLLGFSEDAPVSVRDLLHGTSLTEPALTKLMGHLQIALRANRFMDGSQSYTLHSRVIADHAQRWIDGRRK